MAAPEVVITAIPDATSEDKVGIIWSWRRSVFYSKYHCTTNIGGEMFLFGIQGPIWVWTQQMRDDVTKLRRLSLAEPIPEWPQDQCKRGVTPLLTPWSYVYRLHQSVDTALTDTSMECINGQWNKSGLLPIVYIEVLVRWIHSHYFCWITDRW